MRPNRRAVLLLLYLAFALSACTLPPQSAETGNVTIALTDSPGFAFDNVWVTVRAVWFHKVDTAPFDNTATGWVRFRLDSAVTLNLAALSAGTVHTVWDNLALPPGTYRQMLLFLEPTENALTPSANANNLRFNNQVDAGSLRAALRVPNAAQGIRLAGPFQIDNGALLRIAVDFDIGRDVLPFDRGAVKEFLLQPRLASFDLDNAGAIVGFIDNTAARDNTAFFEVLAEQIDTTLGWRVVRRAAAVDNTTGKFVLYPLEPGTTLGHRYDIVIRGKGWETVIVKEVPVSAGTTPASSPTVLGTAASPIPMSSGSDYVIGGSVAPTGALANLYQMLAGTNEIPYLIRSKRFHPLAGTFDNLSLSSGQLHVDTYDGGVIAPTAVSPVPGNGSFTLSAEADLYTTNPAPNGTSNVNSGMANSTISLAGLAPSAPAFSNSIGSPPLGGITVPSVTAPLDNLVVFAIHGGTIVNAQALGSISGSSIVPYAITNLPGGQTGATFASGVYGISAYGWRTGGTDNDLRIGTVAGTADLRTGNATVNITMTNVTGP